MNSEPTKSENSNDSEPGWFERNVKLIISAVVVACLLTLVAQLVFPMFDEHHPAHFALENVFGFQAALGFLAFVTAVFVGRFLRLIVSREEDYYDT